MPTKKDQANQEKQATQRQGQQTAQGKEELAEAGERGSGAEEGVERVGAERTSPDISVNPGSDAPDAHVGANAPPDADDTVRDPAHEQTPRQT